MNFLVKLGLIATIALSCLLGDGRLAAQAASDEGDREALIYIIRDSLAVADFTDASQDLFFSTERAVHWLDEAGYSNVNAGEAVMNARRVAQKIDEELPALRSTGAAFPENGPSLPPVFFWFEDWSKWQKAGLESLAVSRGHLVRQADALDRGDLDAVAVIQTERMADQAGFNAYFADVDRSVIDALPEMHPDRIVLEIDQTFWALNERNTQRNSEVDPAIHQELTLELSQRYIEAAATTNALLTRLADALDQHREDVQPLVVLLTRDEAAAAPVVDAYIATYHELRRLGADVVAASRRASRLELLYYRDGPSSELFEDFARLSKRFEEFYVARNAAMRQRFEILDAAIAD